ncbi:MAG: cysteine desulfurase NifS [Acidobacteria bacterium]|nr:cysteine desulfurase NifS [Acidobacteriota bacterium]
MGVIYMDHNATTPLDPAVLEAMLPYLKEHFGNPSSTTHQYGKVAREAVEEAREKVARLIKARREEIIFTSGATESDNLAIKGVAYAYKDKGNHIITSSIEHKAVLNTCHFLEEEGFKVTYLPVDRYGLVDPDDVKKAITKETILISIMQVNSEVGTIEPIEEIGRIAKEKGIIFHTDAVQGVGKIETDVGKLNVDLLSISGHKIYGPKGVGALYIRKGLKLIPLIHGGGQERSIRSGTENVPGIVGLGKACEIAGEVMEKEAEKLTYLRNKLVEAVLSEIPDSQLNGHPERRVPGNANFSFRGVEGESLILSLKDFALSSGSACTSASLKASYVLLAMGLPEAIAHCSIRVGLGRGNTEEQIDLLIKELKENVARLRKMSPLYEG